MSTKPRLAVCSWSLQAESPLDLARKVRACGLSYVQLALDPLRRGEWSVEETERALTSEGIGVLSGMMEMAGEDYRTLESIARTGGVLPDDRWQENLTAARANAAIAARLGLPLVTFHAGVIPHGARDPRRAVVLERIRAVADTFREAGAATALETGQEPAAALLQALRQLPGIGVNYDAANMILYGTGDPWESVRILASEVVQYHVKDAVPSATPGTWGTEVPHGTGAVRWPEFVPFLAAKGWLRDLVIEREGGGARVADVTRAREILEAALSS